MIRGEADRVSARNHLPAGRTQVTIGPRSTVADVVRSFLSTGAQELLDGKASISCGDDAEAVHETRVATRHLRSNLQTFGRDMDAVWLAEVRGELAWLARALGAVRDSDVLSDRIRDRASELDARYRPHALELLAALEATGREARQDLRAVMGSPRFDELVARIVEAGASPPMGPGGDERASKVAPSLVSKRWTQLRRAVEALPVEPEDAALHEVRIRVKKCRYTTEAVSCVSGRKAIRLARALRSLQTILGDLHDVAAAQSWLLQAPRSAAQGVAAGLMIAAEAKEREALIYAWQRAWAKTRRPKVVGWLPKP